MGRAVVSVQRVDEGLHSPFIELWITHRIEGGTTPEAAQRLALDGTLRNALQRNDICGLRRVHRRSAGGLRRPRGLDAEPARRLAVRVDRHALRAPRHPAAGIGRALLSAATRYAERSGSEHLASRGSRRTATPTVSSRGWASRPRPCVRVASTATLQRKLAGEPRPNAVSLDLLQRRRDLSSGRSPRHDPKIAG